MKKDIISTLSLILIIIGLLGAIFKLVHWPGASILLVIGGGGLAVLLMIWFFIGKSTDFKYLLALYFVVMLLGILFKLMHWPGANMLLRAGYVLSFIMAGVLLIGKKK